jgi:hypothetical protein
MTAVRAEFSGYNVPDEKFEEVVNSLINLGFDLVLKKQEDGKWDKWISDNKIIYADDLGKITVAADYITLKPIRSLRFPDVVTQLSNQDIPEIQKILNTTMQVRFEQSWLHKVEHVIHLPDGCTNDLENHLKAGWRILAVCPQYGQRRPDYILGKDGSNDRP